MTITKHIRFAVFVYIIQRIIPHVSVVVEFIVHNSNPRKCVTVLEIYSLIVISNEPLIVLLKYTATRAITQPIDDSIQT